MKKQYIGWFAVAILGALILSGCGETIRGMGKDAMRVGKGVKTIFISGN